MGIIINQVHAKIGIERIPSKLEMESRMARLELRQNHAKVNIRTELPRVEIDQYECFASAGLKKPIDLMREAAQRAYQHVLEYIGKVAADGDRFAAIELGGNPIAETAVRDAYPEHEFNIDFIPKARPKITVKGSVQIDPERNAEGANNGVEGKFIPGELKINYIPARIRIYIEQYNQIRFEYRGKNIDLPV
ncbi:MAG TPA: hypothetical protein GXX14_10885 [Clostridiaceae bacterium]|nr:hypothetical protein [Clostridiaceae bacterium]